MNESDMMLARDYAGEDVTGWYASEKLEDVRSYWDGRNFWSRGGNIIPVPTRILDRMPLDFHLDGGMWAGRGNFEIVRQAVQYGRWTDQVEFVAFDAPEIQGDWYSRISTCSVVMAMKCEIIQERGCLFRLLDQILWRSGEGIILRKPGLPYIKGRTGAMLKLKTLEQLNHVSRLNHQTA